MITMRKKGTRTLLWYYANDQKTKVVNEIKSCDCFFDIMLVFKEIFLNLIDENDVDNEILEKTFLDFCFEVDTNDQDVFIIFAEDCIVMCEKTIYKEMHFFQKILDRWVMRCLANLSCGRFLIIIKKTQTIYLKINLNLEFLLKKRFFHII